VVQDSFHWTGYEAAAYNVHPEFIAPKQTKAAIRISLELDCGMINGVVELECRQALWFYVLKQFGLTSGPDTRPEARQINRKSVAAAWFTASASPPSP
jgi:hypothetical protein